MNAAVAPMSALGRLLIPLIFVRAGINKLGAIAATSATMGSHGIPYPDILAVSYTHLDVYKRQA